MNEEIKHCLAVVGVGTTGASSVIAFLPTVNILVQILAGLMAIIVGFYTAKYYREKSIRAKLTQIEKETDL
jgi:predicted transporter